VAIGFGFFIFENASLAMGEAGFLPPWIAAWSPMIALACLIGAFVARAEG
jgi:lipopolysaccharide export LptBFGC system permease protein LptF